MGRHDNMKFEGDYLVREWNAVKPRLAAGESIETINPIKVYRHRAVALETAARIGGSGSLLELGCGASLVLQEASKLGLRCHGVDLDPMVLEYSRALTASYKSNVELSQVDAFELPFPDKSFDVVLSVGMLEHYSPEDQVELVKQHARFAKRFVEIHVPNESPDSCIYHLIKDHADSHLPTDLRALAAKAGLEVLSLEGRGLFVSDKGAAQNSEAYQAFVHARFPHLWKELKTADIDLLIRSDKEATPEERMKFGSIHYIVARPQS